MARTTLITEPYTEQVERWPATGRHILAQCDEDTIIVYQAYRPSIGTLAIEHGEFGGDFSYSRMSWIKPNFLGTRVLPADPAISKRLGLADF